MPWGKVPAFKFLKSHHCAKRTENNRFCVPVHFAINCFTFEIFRLRLHCYTLVYTVQNADGDLQQHLSVVSRDPDFDKGFYELCFCAP